MWLQAEAVSIERTVFVTIVIFCANDFSSFPLADHRANVEDNGSNNRWLMFCAAKDQSLANFSRSTTCVSVPAPIAQFLYRPKVERDPGGEQLSLLPCGSRH
jgi:hypothetical protein